MTNETNKQQIWQFTESQQLLLREQARQHQAELAPFQAYHTQSRNAILVNFTKELGVPEGLPITVDLDNMQFIERQPDPTQLPDEAFTPIEELIDAPEDEPKED